MTTVLVINAGVVVDAISADSVARAQQFYPQSTCVERTAALSAVGPGWRYDGTNFTAPPPADPGNTPITKLEFLRRFTSAQRIAIYGSSDPVIVDALKMLDLAEDVSTDDPDTVALVDYLASQGLLPSAQVASVLE